MDPREIYKSSLNIFHGNKYDKAIESFNLIKKYPENGRCYYHNFYLIFSIKENDIYINKNIILVNQFKIERGMEWNHVIHGSSFLDKEINYEKNLLEVLKYIRNQKIETII